MSNPKRLSPLTPDAVEKLKIMMAEERAKGEARKDLGEGDREFCDCDFDTQKRNLEKVTRKLTQERNRLQCENQVLREELEETRAEMAKKAEKCEILARKVADLTSKRLTGTTSENAQKIQLEIQQIQLNASETRNNFLKDEIQTQFDLAQEIRNELNSSNEKHHKRIVNITSKYQDLKCAMEQERQEFSGRYNAMKGIVSKHQTYIVEIEECLRFKEAEKEDTLNTAKECIREFLMDSIDAMKTMEAINLDLVEANKELENGVEILKKELADIQKEQELEKTRKNLEYESLSDSDEDEYTRRRILCINSTLKRCPGVLDVRVPVESLESTSQSTTATATASACQALAALNEKHQRFRELLESIGEDEESDDQTSVISSRPKTQ